MALEPGAVSPVTQPFAGLCHSSGPNVPTDLRYLRQCTLVFDSVRVHRIRKGCIDRKSEVGASSVTLYSHGNEITALLPRGQTRAGEGDRTLTTSLEGWGSTIELHPRGRNRKRIRRRAGRIRTDGLLLPKQARCQAAPQPVSCDCVTPQHRPSHPTVTDYLTDRAATMLPQPGSLAQLAEQRTLNPQVPGSSPGRPTTPPSDDPLSRVWRNWKTRWV
jgi:hypothetical protein